MAVRVRNILFILCGVAVLVMKPRYAGPYPELVWSYLGNFSASFAVYFLCANAVLIADPFLRARPSFRENPVLLARLGRAAAAVLAFVIVGLFEATDGFQVMSNTYDPVDYAADAAGIVFAVLADTATAGLVRRAGHERRAS